MNNLKFTCFLNGLLAIHFDKNKFVLLHALSEKFALSSNEIRLVQQRLVQEPFAPLPMLLWQYGLISLELSKPLLQELFEPANECYWVRLKKFSLKSITAFGQWRVSNKQGLRWKGNQLAWCGLTIQPIIDWTNPVIKHGLNLIKSVVSGRWSVRFSFRFFKHGLEFSDKLTH